MRELVCDLGQTVHVDAECCCAGDHRLRRGRFAARVVDDKIRQPDRGGVALGLRRVVALDRQGDAGRHAPPTHQHRPDQGVVDPELASLPADPLLGSCIAVVDLELSIQLGKHPAADVVEECRHRQLVPGGQPSKLGDPVGRMAGRHAMTAKALLPLGPRTGGIEGVVALEGGRDGPQAGRVQGLDCLADPTAILASGPAAGRPQHRDGQGGIGFDRVRGIPCRGGPALTSDEQTPARLRQHRHTGDSFEGVREPASALSDPAFGGRLGLGIRALAVALAGRGGARLARLAGRLSDAWLSGDLAHCCPYPLHDRHAGATHLAPTPASPARTDA